MIKALSTKHLDDKTMDYAHSLNFDISCVDFIKIVPAMWDENVLNLHEFDSVAFTSDNAVKYFVENKRAADWIKDKNIFSIAGKTTEKLNYYGITTVVNAMNARQLTEEVVKRKLTNSVLHVCGNMRLDILGKMLTGAEINYHALEVYNTELITGLALETDFDVILFYSPSGVDGFLSANKIDKKTICCCIGDTTSAKLRKIVSPSSIVVSPFPSPKSMIERVAKYFEKTSG